MPRSKRKTAPFELKTVPFELKADDDPDGSTFGGLCAVFNNIDTYRDIIAPGAFKDGLAAFLKDGFVGGLNHNWNDPIGSPTSAEEVAEGLMVGGRVEETTHGRDIRILLKRRVIKKLSIGYSCARGGVEYLESPEDVQDYWAKAGYTPSQQDIERSVDGVRLLTKIKLYEFSPVTVPANDLAVITRVKESPPRGGASLDDQVESLADRLDAYLARKRDDRHSVPPERRAQMSALADRLARLVADAEATALPPTPDPPQSSQAGRLIELRARAASHRAALAHVGG